jgi:dihydroorotase
MPNTEPALDSVAVLAELARRAVKDAAVRLRAIAAITEARRGAREVDFDALAQAGAVGYSDDGQSTADSAIMVMALEASRRNGIPVMVHCEDPALARGAMHDGDVSRRLGIAGIPAAAEEIFIERDLALARLTGGWLHVCHVSTARGADRIDAGRREGVNVTAEVAPHHLLMDDEWVAGRRSFVREELSERKPGVPGHPDTKVNPPLRHREDADGLLKALKMGKIELVATDHAPHAAVEKSGTSFQGAAFGLTGSELAVPLMLELVRGGFLEFSEVVRAFSCVPAKLWNLGTGTLRPGAAADIAVIDVNESWVVGPDRVHSRGLNTPLLGAELRGRVKLTFVGGDERHRDW